MKKMTLRQRQAIETKTKIFTTAMDLFSKKTYESVTVQDICTAAGVSVGAYYHHFKSKNDIIDVGYLLFDQQTEEQFSEQSFDSTFQAVHFLIASQSTSISSLGVIGCTQFYKQQLACENKYIINKDRFFYQSLYANIVKAIENEEIIGNAEEITNEILSATRGLIYDWCLHDGSFSLPKKAEKMLLIIWTYYKKK